MGIVLNTVQKFFSQNGAKPCLFAGAGVGKHAGYKDWREYLEYLAACAERYEPDIASLIRKKVGEENYTKAAFYYMTCDAIPDGEKYKLLREPFDRHPGKDHSRLCALLALPFNAVVTTNFEYALHDAYCLVAADPTLKRPPSPIHIELDKASMKMARFNLEYFIARIHGRSDIPETMVLDESTYKNVTSNEYYRDFLSYVFRDFRCLFVGFSFVDPAIDFVFRDLRNVSSPSSLQPHVALLPNTAPPRLIALLREFNIEIVKYDPAENHKALWDDIAAASRDLRSALIRSEKVPPVTHANTIHRLLATSYTRVHMKKQIKPLQNIAVDTVVFSVLEARQTAEASRDTLYAATGEYLSLPQESLRRVVEESISRLIRDGAVAESDGGLSVCAASVRTVDSRKQVLVDGIASRMRLLHNTELKPKEHEAVYDLLLDIIVLRAWDLGAHYAGSNDSDEFDAWKEIESFIESRTKKKLLSNVSAIKKAVYDLLKRPDPKESLVLAELGRLSFGLELVLQCSNSTLTQNLILPDRIYLDTNFLLPLLLEGHPLCTTYNAVIKRLADTAKVNGVENEVAVLDVFLNEVMHHRYLAQQEKNALDLDDDKVLQRHMLICGAINTNVFISAYSSIRRNHDSLSFAGYLAEYAPYTNEYELAQYLERKGIKIRKSRPEDAEMLKLFWQLNEAFAGEGSDSRERASTWVQKPEVLIRHEAAQILDLKLGLCAGGRPIFVTADQRLLRHVGRLMPDVSSAMISNLGFIQWVDVVVGVRNDLPDMARLLMNVKVSNVQEQVRDYLIHLALLQRDEAMSLCAYQVAESIAEESGKELDEAGIDFVSNDLLVQERSHKFVDRLEESFFKKMNNTVADYKRRHHIDD